MSKDIKITNASYPSSFVCFDIKGLKDGIIVGTYGMADENGIPVGLAIGYNGEQVIVPFKATSDEIKKINKGGDNE